MSVPHPLLVPTTNPFPSPTPVRYAEKRRTSTCRFADRIAQFCVDHYRAQIPGSFRETQKQTCLAAIVAFVKPEGSDHGNEHNNDNEEVFNSDLMSDISHSNKSKLYMLGMGVGTKFLSSDMLNVEMGLLSQPDANKNASTSYGKRVRDCHAEVLARRAFRRQLSLEILQDLQSSNKDSISKPEPFSILQRTTSTNGSVKFALRPGVSLHMYSSSAPCGNATLKKFATMKQVKFRENLDIDEWPADIHEPMIGHSVNLGQFALLVKRDPGRASSTATATGQLRREMSTGTTTNTNETQSSIAKKRKVPVMQSTDWCPPGTSTVWANEGSIHTCSDKLCRWNCLGLQGSLLASLLEQPLFMSSLTVGRKLTECICRRAVCCRASASNSKKKKRNRGEETGQSETATAGNDRVGAHHRSYKINHPAIMGTQVYMDETGVIDMSRKHYSQKGETAMEGQDVRFHNTLSWAWWPSITLGDDCAEQPQLSFECIDGISGLAVTFEDTKTLCSPKHNGEAARVSTLSLLILHMKIQELCGLTKEPGTVTTEDGNMQKQSSSRDARNLPMTLRDLRAYKKQASPEYEAEKHELLTKHPVFRQWKRREETVS